MVVGATQPPTTVPNRITHPLVGFTFLAARASDAGYEPATALAQLLRQLHPDLVRIPVYWSTVATSADELDFTAVDQLLDTVAASNSRRRAHQTQVILVAGVRNLAYPEVHVPDLAGHRDQPRPGPDHFLRRLPALPDRLFSALRHQPPPLRLADRE